MEPPELPSADEREWILDGLADLIEEHGAGPFVAAPLVTNTDACFPDRASDPLALIQVRARRLLDLAGIADARAVVHDGRSAAPPDEAFALQESIIEYRAFTDTEFEFVVHKLGGDDVTGLLAHEAGVAFRHYNGLREVTHPYRGTEQIPEEELEHVCSLELGSLATIYLGLGVLGANAAHSPRHGGGTAGVMHYTSWHIMAAGGLPAQALCFALAVQAEVRGADDDAYKALLTNQKKDFAAWRSALAGQRDRLIEQLGLPPVGEWPAPWAASPRPYDDEVAPDSKGADELRQFNKNQPVFRVRNDRRISYAALGAMGAGALGFAAIPYAGLVAPLLAACGGALVAGARGARLRADFCSDPNCSEPLAPDDEVCRCGGWVAGEIGHPNERLDAEESLRDRLADADDSGVA